MIKKTIEFKKNNGYVIRGTVFIPEAGNGKYPVVIYSHGFNCTHEALMQHGSYYTDAGFVCIMCDFCGGALTSISDGSMSDMTVETESEDLECIISGLKDLEYADENNLYLIGESQGGYISAYVASRNPQLIRRIVLWFPAFVIKDDSARRNAMNNHEVFGISLNPDFDRIGEELDIYAQMKKYSKPVLIIHGDQDDIVPLDYSNRAVSAFPDAELVIVNGAGHGFANQDLVDARERTIEFFLEDYEKYNEQK